jgi:dihydrofolate reductase/thymidylate synthase
MEFQVVVAACETKDGGLGIGRDNKLPWQVPDDAAFGGIASGCSDAAFGGIASGCSDAAFGGIASGCSDAAFGGIASGCSAGDMAYFRELTSRVRDGARRNAVIMGLRTWESIPVKFRPLKGRLNVLLTRLPSARAHIVMHADADPDADAEVLVCGSLQEALHVLHQRRQVVETVFVIGGGHVYREALASEACAAIHLTRIEGEYECDTTLPALPERFKFWSASAPRDAGGGVKCTFMCYTDVGRDWGPHAHAHAHAHASSLPPGMASRHEEHQYLELAERVLSAGVFRPDRTGTGTYSLFGNTMRFDLRHTFPLLTTKRVFWRGVVEELLWFIRGGTDAHELSEKGVRIWDGNSSRAYLDSVGLAHREEGDLGPVYGFQWRHFGARYEDRHTDYTGQGVDQLADVIARIKADPADRRLVLSAWNPVSLPEMALPPCHMFAQFYVAHGELSCLMYQRSCDVGLGVPFNIASYALLTCMVAQVCGLRRGEFVHMMGDTHIYASHVEPLREQLRNAPRAFPTLTINPIKTDIDTFVFEDFSLEGYRPHKRIEMPMAV